MAYDSTKLDLILGGNIANSNGPQVWSYRSTDAASVVDTSGYIADGGDRGMKVGDVVFVQDTDNSYLTTCHAVLTVSSTAPGAVDLTDGVAITSVTNSD